MARVSIITALYNHEKYIRKAIESVLSQTYSDWELLIWDDGSQDQSLQIAQSYAQTHPKKIKIYTHDGAKNQGQEKTRNSAIKKASGEFLCLLDSDDFYHPEKLEKLLPCFHDKKVGLAYGKVDFFFEDAGRIRSSGIQHTPQGNVLKELLKDNFLCAGGTMFRYKCLEENKTMFDSSFQTCGEYPLWIEIARSWTFCYVPDVVAFWRTHPQNTGKKLSCLAKQELVWLTQNLLSNRLYESYTKELKEVLVQRHYDYACVLYDSFRFQEAKDEFKKILQKPKAKILFYALGLGSVINFSLVYLKRWLGNSKKILHG